MRLNRTELAILRALAGSEPTPILYKLRLETVPQNIQRAAESLRNGQLIRICEDVQTLLITEWGKRALENPNSVPSLSWARALKRDLESMPKWWVCCEIAEIIRASPIAALVDNRISGDGWRFDVGPFLTIIPVSCNIGGDWNSLFAECEAWVQLDLWNQNPVASHRPLLDIFFQVRDLLLSHSGSFLCYPNALLRPTNSAGQPDYLTADRLRSDWRVFAGPNGISLDTLRQRQIEWKDRFIASFNDPASAPKSSGLLAAAGRHPIQRAIPIEGEAHLSCQEHPSPNPRLAGSDHIAHSEDAMPDFDLSTDSSPDEIRQHKEFAQKAEWFVGLSLIRVVEFLQDFNRIKSPIPKAERILLAHRTCRVALDTGKQLGRSIDVELSSKMLVQVADAYCRLVPLCISALHEERLAMLRKSKSRSRQATIARKALEQLERLAPYTPDASGHHAGTLVGEPLELWRRTIDYWRTQRGIVQ